MHTKNSHKGRKRNFFRRIPLFFLQDWSILLPVSFRLKQQDTRKRSIQAILPDRSMCVAILKIANSALYGRSERVNSLETAIMVLGFNEVRNIVLGRSVVTAFGRCKKNKAAIDQFWDHSFTCGLAAKTIAEHLGLSSPGQFFVGGLIHDIGKLAMLLTFPDEYSPDQ